MPDPIRIARPDDWHLHLRDGAALAAVLPHSARQFARAIVMPNLRPPIVRVEQALAYRERILEALPAGRVVRAADDALPDRQHRRPRRCAARARPASPAIKLYPAGATTNSDAGVTDLRKIARGARGDASARA